MIGRILHTFIAWCAAKRTQWMCYMWPQDVCSAQQFYFVSRPPLNCIKSDGWWLMVDGWWTKGCRAIFIAACYIFDVLIWICFFRTACQRLLRRRNSWVFGSMESTVSHRYESHISSTFVFFFIICLPILVSYCCDCEHICNNNNNRKVKTTVNFLYPFIWIVIFVVWNNWRTTHQPAVSALSAHASCVDLL